MVKGVTKSGFKFEVDPADANDMEFLERLGEAMDNVAKFPKIMSELLGKDQRDRLYDHLRNEKGKVPIDVCMNTFEEILTMVNEERETKN